MNADYLSNIKKQFRFYKKLGEKTFEQLNEKQLFWQLNNCSNSIAIIVNHLWGNMLSRWTEFLTTDGEKKWRKRDEEFENIIKNKKELLTKWDEGWNCLFTAINGLTAEDLTKIVFIRNQKHTVTEAITRQLTHYSYHIGQIVYLGKMLRNDNWNSLSIAKGKSKDYNKEQFSKN